MKPLDLKEWAESLICAGDHVDYAREVLDLLDLEQRCEYLEGVAEDLTRPDVLKRYAGEEHKAADFLIDRHNLLDELAEQVEAVMPGKGLALGLEALIAEWEDMRAELDALKSGVI